MTPEDKYKNYSLLTLVSEMKDAAKVVNIGIYFFQLCLALFPFVFPIVFVALHAVTFVVPMNFMWQVQGAVLSSKYHRLLFDVCF